MDQKHAMLYPDPNAMSDDQRSSAATALGLPVEPPPTYDVATQDTSSSAHLGWTPKATDTNYPTSAPKTPATSSHHLPAVAEQGNFQLSANQTPEPTQTQQQPTDGVPVTPIRASKLGPNPSNIACPNCGVSKTTRMTFTPNTKTHLSALVLCLVGWCFCACIVPYCMNSCRTGNHYCSNCNAFLGTFNPKSHSSRHGRRNRP